MTVFSDLSELSLPDTSQEIPSKFTQPDLYYNKVQNKAPHKTLLTALDLFASESVQNGSAVDIGCGAGRDSLFLINRGWKVLAIDREPRAFEYLASQLNPNQSQLFSPVIVKMEEAIIPNTDLINASLSLPFCDPRCFMGLWKRISEGLPVNGRFAGHFFGDRDSWAHEPMQTHFTLKALKQLFADFKIEYLEEIEDDEPSLAGEAKHWHVFHIVARKL